jgi:hypothetical protein
MGVTALLVIGIAYNGFLFGTVAILDLYLAFILLTSKNLVSNEDDHELLCSQRHFLFILNAHRAMKCLCR